MEELRSLLQNFVPSGETQSQALAICHNKVFLELAQPLAVALGGIINFQAYPIPIRLQAADRLFELVKSLCASELRDRALLHPIKEAGNALLSLPKDSLSGLEYEIESTILELKTTAAEKGITRESLDLLDIGRSFGRLSRDVDAVFVIEESALETLLETSVAENWIVVFQAMGNIVKTASGKPSLALQKLLLSTIGRANLTIEQFPSFEAFVSISFEWFSSELQSRSSNLYAETAQRLNLSPNPALLPKPKSPTPTLFTDISDLISDVIKNQTLNTPSDPVSIKSDIKRIADKHKVKDANEVFQALKSRFLTVASPEEVQGSMLVLKATQLSKNLTAAKLTELYNTIHKIQKKSAPFQEEENKKKIEEGKEPESVGETFLTEVRELIPESLPKILLKANSNAYSVLQSYTAKKSEFLKCVDLFRLISVIVKEDLPGYEVHTFGSLAHGTWTKYSTVDITLYNPEVSEFVLPLNILLGSLKLHPDLKLDPVFKSKYPVLRVKRADSYFWVNITINNVMGMEIAKLVDRYCGLDRRVPEMIVYVKVWAHINNITQSKLGFPAGYSWTLLVLHFLMQSGVIPCLQAKPHDPVLKDNCDVWVDEEPCEITDKRSLGHLLTLFFYHYGVIIPQTDCALDLRSGQVVKIDPTPVLYAVIQPFEESRPLFTLHRAHDTGKRVINCMRRAYNNLVSLIDVIKLN